MVFEIQHLSFMVERQLWGLEVATCYTPNEFILHSLELVPLTKQALHISRAIDLPIALCMLSPGLQQFQPNNFQYPIYSLFLFVVAKVDDSQMLPSTFGVFLRWMWTFSQLRQSCTKTVEMSESFRPSSDIDFNVGMYYLCRIFSRFC